MQVRGWFDDEISRAMLDQFHGSVSACVLQEHQRIHRLILLQRLDDDHPDGWVAVLYELLKGMVQIIRTIFICDGCLMDVPQW